MKHSLISEFHADENQIAAHCRTIYEHLAGQQEGPFVLWLDGEMGAGKTTFVRHLLKSIGLNPNIPVVSPTYTLMNEYEIAGNWYAHIDFYRANAAFSLAEMGILDAREFKGIFIEWPETPPEGQNISPTHLLQIRPDGDEARRYRLEKID
jgi:tRNA threonylcarbamoyl adenosine modification protein YjeE